VLEPFAWNLFPWFSEFHIQRDIEYRKSIYVCNGGFFFLLGGCHSSIHVENLAAEMTIRRLK